MALMSSPLHVVALISGGKDSLFSALHCLQNGHKITALANLHPPVRSTEPERDAFSDQEEEDMNSFMYQTVGHQIIPLYADALGIPLYRQQITGSALQTGRYYDTSEQGHHRGDETEDLLELLQEVVKHHPDVNSVSSGAILSTYQRTRVESVAIRLGLTPLAYLWQYPALPPPAERADSLTGLLDDMAAAGCDARIIKIASGGMKENLLWSNVTEPRTMSRLVSGLGPFFPGHEFGLRGAVLGEGGEYETLALDGPSVLWKKRLVFDDSNIEIVSGEGGVYHTHLTGATTAGKIDSTRPDADEASIRVPKFYDPHFEAIQGHILVPASNDQWQQDHSNLQILAPPKPSCFPKPEMVVSPTCISLSNVVADDLEVNAAAQMSQIVRQVKTSLSSTTPSMSPSNIVSVLLLLSSISDFATINPVYASLFAPGEPNPPARVTIAVDLPANTRVSFSMVVSPCPQNQLRGLHVQSRSYWAPANIGPYSQAICEPAAVYSEDTNVHDPSQLEIVHFAGQIPLVPQSMEMLVSSFPEQALLSLQHLWRIGQERGVDVWPWGVALLSSTGHTNTRAQAAYDVWLHAHTSTTDMRLESSADEEEVQDVWFSQHNHFLGSNRRAEPISVGEHLHKLPNHAVINWSTLNKPDSPAFVAAEVVSLPRDASIEWWSLGIANVSNNAGRASFMSRSWAWAAVDALTVVAKSTQDASPSTTVLFMTIFLSAQSDFDERLPLGSIMEEMGIVDDSELKQPTVTHATALLAHRSNLRVSEIYRSLGLMSYPALIPCRHIWGALPSENSSGRVLEPIDFALLLRLELQ